VVNKAYAVKMKLKSADRPMAKAAAVRASISFPADVYETLEAIARENKVSLAWVVREAAEKYIADRWPLFVGPKGV